MSVFGVDFGALNSVVAVTRQGGVDIVCNEVSKRDTATFVSYMGDERLIGEAAFDKAVRNWQNTIPCVKRLIGLRQGDARLESEMRFVQCNHTFDKDGRLQLEVDFNDNTLALYPEQVLAAFLGKLRKYVALETKTDAKDCVISVPCWYTAEQRKLVIQASEIAGLHSLSLINETTASSVDYGIFRVALLPEKEEEAQIVAVLDLGYAGTTVTISKFWKGNMRVLAHAWDHELSTREIEWTLAQHFRGEIKAKYNVDVTSNKRATIRLLQGCDKLKCMLSANATAPLNIENLMDVDVNLLYTREQLEQVINPLCDRLKALAAKAMQKAGLEMGSLTALELIGGGSRVPLFKSSAAEAFGVPSSFTLNASESIARGCAITAATFSPLFQVREYIVNEAPLCPLMLGYHSDKAEGASVSFLPSDINKVSALLRDTDRYPKTLELTFNRAEQFDLYAFYDETHDDAQYVPKGPRSIIGHWVVGGPNGKQTTGTVKLRIKLHANGLVNIESASTQEVTEKDVEETVKADASPPPPPVEGAEGEAPKEAETKPKKQTVKKQFKNHLDLTVTPQLFLGNDADTVIKCKKLEAEHDARDLTIQRTREVRNELESYVYDNRSRISEGDLKDFVNDADRKSFVALASEIEQWLYGDGDNAPLNEYQTRLDKLKVVGAATIRRQRLADDIPFAHGNFEKAVAALQALAEEKRGKAEHITNEDIDGALAKCSEALQWGTSELQAYQAKPKFEDPTLAPSTFDNKTKEVDAAVKAVVNKKAPPKPKKEEAKKDDAAPASPAGEAPPPAPETKTPTGPDAPADLD